MELRPYQEDLLERTRALMRKHKRVLMQAPTGAGKTALTARMLGTAAAKGKRAFFLVHRAELIEQSVAAFDEAGIPHGVIAAGWSPTPYQPVQIASVDTLRRRLDRIQQPDLVAWDECHHCAAATWKDIQAAMPNAWHVGLTATPERLDGKGLDAHFDAMALGPPVAELIDDGYLCDYRVFAPSAPNTDACRSRAGDFAKDQLAEIIEKSQILGDAVAHYRDICPGARAVAFCANIKHSMALVEQFASAGVPAAHIDGKMDRRERRQTIAAFRAGRIRVLSNVDIVGEGFDLPAIEAAILLRPTQSLGLHLQQVGRALRPYPGKDRAILLDHAGNTVRHGLPDEPRQWSLEGRTQRQQSEAGGLRVRVCKDCFATFAASRGHCPECGVIYPTQEREVEQVEGTLEEMGADEIASRREKAREQASAQSLEALVDLGYRRGHSNPHGWARHVKSAREKKRLDENLKRAGIG